MPQEPDPARPHTRPSPEPPPAEANETDAPTSTVSQLVTTDQSKIDHTDPIWIHHRPFPATVSQTSRPLTKRDITKLLYYEQ
ncbi:hypothetical protein DPMN_116963 [Dreissena polymorpha]|uniref:Uncharacterized protein n=1 Tax=Dreissena polymorpha TaxID=45954 RepID=A0A9D4KPM3_DREPO|nr:hypothetical protein DPMN_116963 [Dreissena polymorpha]